ncbi:glycosyltransferase [Streptosporangium sp. NPDC006013]|uniref:glycosyltransferase family 2 protein n=1 Tax=Streptosporangium sp. NPDC006013 TaxID=3155596 RepID=UPI0033A40773
MPYEDHGALISPANVRIGVVILTMGDRPAELTALLDSVEAQSGPTMRTVVVGNGTRLGRLPAGVEGLELPENRGISGGRNAALAVLRDHGDIDVVMYLDDDGLLPRSDTADTIRRLFAHSSDLGIVSFRIADETGYTQRRHVPRLRTGQPLRASEVTTFLGGGNAIRMAVVDDIGTWPESFFYAHEETDVAWRALDAGWRIEYRPELVLQHPRTSPTRHAVYFRMVARNRVWLARRHLPAALIPIYLATWTVITVVRRPPLAGLRAWGSGFIEGCTTSCGNRRPMRWSTVWRMARLGRPPLI